VLTERTADQARRDKAEMATENLHQTKSTQSTKLRNGEIKWTESRWPWKPESGKKFLSLSGVAVNRKKEPVEDLLGEEKNQPWSLCRAGPKLTENANQDRLHENETDGTRELARRATCCKGKPR
jgi:hypothetical protein